MEVWFNLNGRVAIVSLLCQLGVDVRLLLIPLAAVSFIFQTVTSRADDVATCKSDNPDSAIPACSKLLKRPGLSGNDRAQVHARRGILLLRNGRIEEALADGIRAIDADRKFAGGYYTRGLASVAQNELDRAMADFNRAAEVNPKFAWAYYGRGGVHRRLGNYDKAISEYGLALALDAKQPWFFNDRAVAYGLRGDIDRAFSDFRKALEINPKFEASIVSRGLLYGRKGEFDRALAEITRALESNPKSALGHAGIGIVYVYQGEFERAIPPLTRAIEISPVNPDAYSARGRAYAMLGQVEKASADVERAIRIDSRHITSYVTKGYLAQKQGDGASALGAYERALMIDPRAAEAYALRAEVYLEKRSLSQAATDLRKVLSLPARTPLERNAQIKAAETLTSLAPPPSNPATIPIATTTPSSEKAPAVTPSAEKAPAIAYSATGRRVALVIGNSTYAHAGVLKNPSNDAKAVANTLRQVGFTEVTALHDLGLPQMSAALKAFGDRAAGADWAVIYFAGHGLEIGGVAYLLPTDAKLERDTHVPYETVPLDRMVQTTETAKKLRLVILDACRNNPFVARMARTGSSTRAIGTGLPAIEVEGDVLVAYATKHGTTASDGEGDNSPYALALVQNMPAPNVDIRVMFGRVRDAVRKITRNQQEPYTYGSIGGDLHYFVAARQN